MHFIFLAAAHSNKLFHVLEVISVMIMHFPTISWTWTVWWKLPLLLLRRIFSYFNFICSLISSAHFYKLFLHNFSSFVNALFCHYFKVIHSISTQMDLWLEIKTWPGSFHPASIRWLHFVFFAWKGQFSEGSFKLLRSSTFLFWGFFWRYRTLIYFTW